MMINDPYILFSIINTKLRDSGLTLCDLCRQEMIDVDEVKKSLSKIGYEYSKDLNCFQKSK